MTSQTQSQVGQEEWEIVQESGHSGQDAQLGIFMDTSPSEKDQKPILSLIEPECAVHKDDLVPTRVSEPSNSCQGENHRKPTKLAHHGADYDFTLDEITPSLSTFRGWQAEIIDNDRQIRDRLCSCLSINGHYMIFYWEKKKRPAIAISHEGQIKTFVIHKKPANELSGKKAVPETLYYIDRKGPYTPDLKTLLDVHMLDGIPPMSRGSSRDLIKLLYPIYYSSAG